jgi:CHAT domain-containing protein
MGKSMQRESRGDHSRKPISYYQFYRNIKQMKLSKAEALRQAKLSLMKRSRKIGNAELFYSHPFFWVPFILVGGSD